MERKSSLEELLAEFVKESRGITTPLENSIQIILATMQTPDKSIENLEMKMS